MDAEVKVTAIGNSLGIILSKDLIRELNLEKGDILHVSKTPDGIQLSPYDAEFAEQIRIARLVMKEDRDVLRRLAE